MSDHKQNPNGSDTTPTGKAKGGFARAEALTGDQRTAIAKRAAKARWATPRATHAGFMRFEDIELACANLPNGDRVIAEATMLSALGRGYSGYYSQRDALAPPGSAVPPRYLSPAVLKEFIPEELSNLQPIPYLTPAGSMAKGVKAESVPLICEVWLKAREAGRLNDAQLRTAARAEIILRGLARVGIIALVDEATGYQEDRAKDALVRILEAFIAKELQPYIPTFPTDYYRELFRLRGLAYPDGSVKRPQYFGTLTNDLVYKRLAPGVLEELKRVTPRTESGRHKDKFFRRLTQNKGYPKLMEHLGSIVTMMKLSDTWHQFMERLERLHPRCNETMLLPLEYRKNEDDGRGL
jgi:P63C domain-containing protein